MLQITPEAMKLFRGVLALTENRLRRQREAVRLRVEQRRTRKLNQDKFKNLVNIIANVLRTGEPTFFRYQAICQQTLRSRLCLSGWRWSDADIVAHEIVTTALLQIGAKRPTWEEGQPEYAQNGAGTLIERTRCVACHGRLEGEQTKFCCSICASFWHSKIDRVKKGEDWQAYDLIAHIPLRR